MKQEVYHPAWLVLSKLLSGLLHPLWFLFSHTKYFPAIDKCKIKKIIIGEYHCIGDVILIVPALKILKKHFPDAELTLITNPDTQELAEEMKIVHEVISFQAPWVRGKITLKNWKRAIAFKKHLKKKCYNMGIDFRGDLRNLFFLWFINPTIRIGFTATGGKFLLTHPLIYPFQLHEQERAFFLLKKIGLQFSKTISPIILPKPKDSRSSRIIIHPGANHPERKWPVNHWIALIRLLIKSHNITLIHTEDVQNDTRTILSNYPDLEVFNGSLLDFGGWLQNQKLLIGMDSMAVHLSSLLGVPALAIFGSQNPNLTGPYGEIGHTIKPEKLCLHKRKNWRLCSQCLESVNPESVYQKTVKILDKSCQMIR